VPSLTPAAGTTTATGAPEIPQRAQGVELLGAMSHSGFREPPSLVRRGDGQVVQLTDLLYKSLEAVDGRRNLEEVAAELSRSAGVDCGVDAVRFLVQERLRPLGLLAGADGSQPEVRKANPLLALRCRVVVSNPRRTEALARPFAWLFRPPVVATALVVSVTAVAWVLLAHGLAPGIRRMFYEPEMIVLVFALTAASAGFHELGHAAACLYGGGRPGAMGFGIYLVWPAFYTDVTDSYRLDRRGRLRTDLGGLYFNCLFTIATVAVWAATGWEALLVLVPLQLLQMVHQLLPIIRLDGYHILADATGVPDLFSRIRPTLRSAIPGVRPDHRVMALKPAARLAVTAWVLLVFPILFVALGAAALALPRVLATAGDSLAIHVRQLVDAWLQGDLFAVVAGALSVVAIVVPVAGTAFIVQRMATRAGRHLWRHAPNDVTRAALAAVGLAAVVALAVLWWPNGDYRPIRPEERWRAQDIVAAVPAASTGRPALALGGPAATTVAADAAVAPSATPRAAGPTGRAVTAASEGDRNIAIAANARDGASIFRLAFSVRLVADGILDQTNAAIALASCTDCRTVALAFQLLLVVGDVDVAVPQNIAIARNARCAYCLTFASATQLILGFDRPVQLTDEGVRRLAELRWRLALLAQRADALDAEALAREVEAAKAELLAIVEEEVVAVEPDDGDEAVTTSSTSTTAPRSSSTTTTSTSTTSTTSSTTTSTSTATTSTTSTTSTTVPSTTTTSGG
jgi:putative peptide zinc metalloprotease protein